MILLRNLYTNRLLFLWIWLTFPGNFLQAQDYVELLRQAAENTSAGKYDIAINQYQSALNLKPGAVEALNNLAVLYYQVRRYREAYDLALGVWEKHAEMKSAALIAGLAAIQCNRPQDALDPLEHLLTAEPGNRNALLGLAGAYFALRQYPKAISVYRRETSASPKDAMAWYGLAVCLERMAEDSSRKLAAMPGGSAYSKRLLAEYLQSTGDKKLAEEAFGESQQAGGKLSPEAMEQYSQAKDLAEQSKQAFETFVALAPDSWQAAIFFGDVARQHSDLQTALAHYQKASQAQPDSPAPDLGLGTVYWELGDFDRATTHLEATLKRNPQAMQAVFELGNIAVRLHKETEAIPLLQQYLTAQPDALAAHADLGRAYLHLGKYSEAAGELAKAAASDDRGEIHYQLSLALRKLGRAEEADKAMRESTTLRQSQAARDQRLHQTP